MSCSCITLLDKYRMKGMPEPEKINEKIEPNNDTVVIFPAHNAVFNSEKLLMVKEVYIILSNNETWKIPSGFFQETTFGVVDRKLS